MGHAAADSGFYVYFISHEMFIIKNNGFKMNNSFDILNIGLRVQNQINNAGERDGLFRGAESDDIKQYDDIKQHNDIKQHDCGKAVDYAWHFYLER